MHKPTSQNITFFNSLPIEENAGWFLSFSYDEYLNYLLV